MLECSQCKILSMIISFTYDVAHDIPFNQDVCFRMLQKYIFHKNISF